MSSEYVATKDLHTGELRVRLKEIPYAELLLISQQTDIPKNVLARQFVMEGLRKYLEEQRQQQNYTNAQSA